jgi:hypothetical protein
MKKLETAQPALCALILRLTNEGLSARAIARFLTAQGFKTSRGGAINHAQVRRVVRRAGGG